MHINAPAPDLSLPDTTGHTHSLSVYRGSIVVVNFWSAECPWSERADTHLIEAANQSPAKVIILPVASNLNENIEMIMQAMQRRGLDFVLLDSSCALADSWGAQTTPHAFVIDQTGVLRYQGAVDDVTFRKRSPERFFVQEALLAVSCGHSPEIQEVQPYGCSIVRNPIS